MEAIKNNPKTQKGLEMIVIKHSIQSKPNPKKVKGR